MAIDVKFYIFSKKNNSTAQPSNVVGGNTEYITTFSCLIKDNSGIISPVISVQGGSTFNPAYIVGLNKTLNYAYIQAYGNRYYFIDEWTYAGGYWTASLRLDHLASWKSYIGATSAYVLRSASEHDDNIVDGVYPMKGATSISNASGTNPFSISQYVVGIYGSPETSDVATHGVISYYAMSENQMKKFTSELFSENMSAKVVNKLINPMQYIACCYKSPFTLGTGLPVNIHLGWFALGSAESPATGSVISNPTAIGSSVNITIPKHPEASTKGAYLKLSPYSRYTLFAGPFGVIPLNAGDLYGQSTLKLGYSMDLKTGLTVMVISAGNKELGSYIANCAIDVPVVQLESRREVGMLTTAAMAGVAVAEGNIFAAASAIGNAAQSMIPQVVASGSSGSEKAFYNPYIMAEFTNITDLNDDHKGRPLCQEKTLNTLSGYIQVMDGEIVAPASATELESIKESLEAGFFYE